MPKFELLLGANEFWSRCQQDIRGAKTRVYVQAMTFEGDDAGLPIAEAVRVTGAIDRRILVDSYTRFVISDRFVLAPHNLLQRSFRQEVMATRGMFQRLRDSGVGVRFTNPVGMLWRNFPHRNHKKLVVVDDNIAYVGGINFSDHNFEWHDLMVRIEDAELAKFLREDFEATWENRSVNRHMAAEGTTLYSFNGSDNRAAFEPFLKTIAQAQRSIHVISPYLTFPFTDSLAAATRRGVKVTLLTPFANNKKIIRDYLCWEAVRSNFDLRLYDQMSHLKAMLIDDAQLVVGSCNFDFVSYHTQEEIVAVLTDRALISTFRERVLDPDLASSRPPTKTTSPLRGRLSHWALSAAAAVVRSQTKPVEPMQMSASSPREAQVETTSRGTSTSEPDAEQVTSTSTSTFESKAAGA